MNIGSAAKGLIGKVIPGFGKPKEAVKPEPGPIQTIGGFAYPAESVFSCGERMLPEASDSVTPGTYMTVQKANPEVSKSITFRNGNKLVEDLGKNQVTVTLAGSDKPSVVLANTSLFIADDMKSISLTASVPNSTTMKQTIHSDGAVTLKWLPGSYSETIEITPQGQASGTVKHGGLKSVPVEVAPNGVLFIKWSAADKSWADGRLAPFVMQHQIVTANK